MDRIEEWFDSIYIEHFDQMVKQAFGILRDWDLAEDIAQNAFVTLLLKQEQLKYHSNLKGWLAKTVRNLIGNELQKAYHSLEIPLLPDHESAAESPAEFLSLLPPGLSEDERQLLYLFYEVGLTHEEIAARSGRTEAACRMRLYRAKKHCQALYGKE